MQINFTPEQRDVVRYAVETGSVHDPEEAVQQAMALWMERQRRRAEILARVNAAEASHARGESLRVATEADRQKLIANISQRGRARLEAEKSQRS